MSVIMHRSEKAALIRHKNLVNQDQYFAIIDILNSCIRRGDGHFTRQWALISHTFSLTFYFPDKRKSLRVLRNKLTSFHNNTTIFSLTKVAKWVDIVWRHVKSH